MQNHSPVGVQPLGCSNVAQLRAARNFLRSTHAGWTDARMLALNHWENINAYRASIRMLAPLGPRENPKPPPRTSQSPAGAQLFALRPDSHSSTHYHSKMAVESWAPDALRDRLARHVDTLAG